MKRDEAQQERLEQSARIPEGNPSPGTALDSGEALPNGTARAAGAAIPCLPGDGFEKLAFNQIEAAALCGISVTTLWRETKLGKVRRTSRGVYPRAELERYLQADLVNDEFAAKKLKRLGTPNHGQRTSRNFLGSGN